MCRTRYEDCGDGRLSSKVKSKRVTQILNRAPSKRLSLPLDFPQKLN